MEFLRETGFKRIIINYMVVSACITATMGTIGVLFAPDFKLGYGSFFAPFLFATVGMLPAVVYYSRKILSQRQRVFREILHFILLEVVILTFAWYGNALTSVEITVAIAVSVLVIDVVVFLLMKVNNSRVAIEFNAALKRMQEEEAAE